MGWGTGARSVNQGQQAPAMAAQRHLKGYCAECGAARRSLGGLGAHCTELSTLNSFSWA
jgi:hypothetical protein